jgi:hypothetical protein
VEVARDDSPQALRGSTHARDDRGHVVVLFGATDEGVDFVIGILM